MDPTGQDARYQQAKQRVEALKGFYTHLAVYTIFNTGLFLLNLATDRGNWWFYWPLLGWGVALAIHAVVLLTIEGPRGHAWEERKIRELMERDQSAGQA
ncbi:MAG TPA: 2TM domain-containing protein [Thermomicrobiales bacterium]|jgi:hypothetical protein